MNSSSLPHSVPGRVYFVGAGPGDPGLLTLRGAQYLGEADVVLYDELLDRRLLDLASPTAERIGVGHRGGDGRRALEHVFELLITHARAGKRVVRLKGGDPYVFGRGGEEALAVRDAGIPFEVVSGVSAASGVLAYAGIPLTHRNLAAIAVLVTGHEDPTKDSPSVNWHDLAVLDATLVIFMGNRRLADIAEALIAGGRDADTPTAVIEWGTWPSQRTVVGSLQTITGEVKAGGLHSPALIVVGEVVSLREQLSWFEAKPLFGRRVLITRSREQSGSLQLLLESEGAAVTGLPVLDIQPPDDWSPVDETISNLTRFDWVVFTSPNSVDYFFLRMHHFGLDSRALGGVAVASVGQATAEALHSRGVTPDLVPEKQSQEGLSAAFEQIPVDGTAILVPASSIGRTLLDDALRERGAEVSRVVAYQNRPPAPSEIEWPAALEQGDIDLFVFASPSSVHNFYTVVGDRARALLSEKAIASIGPTTSQALTEVGLQPTIEPAHSSVPALVAAICAHYESKTESKTTNRENN